MTAVSNATENVQKRVSWNKGKIVDAKPPLGRSTFALSGRSSRLRDDPRCGVVQHRHRQQASWLRRGGFESR
jgi:hypothetical protein